MPENPQPLYGSVPYIQALDAEFSSSVTWVNSAHTWVEIETANYQTTEGKYTSFLSESGVMDFFVSASSMSGSGLNRVKKVQRNLADLSGYMPLPQIHAVGFHFCKWYNISADVMMERNELFTAHGFPIDVLWMDIEWADQYSDPAGYEYFIFNPQNFTTEQIERMN